MIYIAVGVPLYSDRCLRFSLKMVDLNSNQEKLAKCLYTFQTNIAYTAFIDHIMLCQSILHSSVNKSNLSAKNNLHTLRAKIEELARVTKT